ncbi:RnfABCDGE type electron transport complex subunit D [Neiella sp. HB171785]|uniref:Ion-translocating oxidoreductase complex subunit D n=1 Tax=Neiella litorisoli TaxID=2771431 RepID=A0A8J6QH00_9GAMM|nr:RnfABCDGE type electron transport complex subunit D [Neiella litorisoli]MBD1388208.1 RnfABCDGE type electron transport complex subunit D [Neiella litorisoli]
MVQFTPVAGPHTHGGTSTTDLMYLVIAALLPASLFGVYLFGINALIVLLTCCCGAMVFEYLGLKLLGRSSHSAMDGSALLTGLLLGLSLPPSTPWWIALSGVFFAIIVGKTVFGGLGQNPFNPAMLGRVMLLICFPVELTNWQQPTPPTMTDGGLAMNNHWLNINIDGISAATPLSQLAGDVSQSLPSFTELSLGQHAGSLGETSALLILLGGLFLLWRGIIHWRIPVALLLGLAIPAAISHLIAPESFGSATSHVLSGGAMLAAFFIATDMVTSPTSAKGQLLFGAGCGLLIWLIRSFGSYPEGVAFAVLIMNATTPVIDHYLRPTVFGQAKRFPL